MNQPDPETARALLYRHGLPEDVIDGALCLHAQELAAVQRLRMDELDLTGQKARIVGCIVDLIDPTKTATPAVQSPADRAAEHACSNCEGINPSTCLTHPKADSKAALRERIAEALIARIKQAVVPRPEPWGGQVGSLLAATEFDLADAVLAVLPESADRAVVRAETLTDTDRQFLTFALDLAADQMASRGDEFDSDDEAALEKLRRLAGEQPEEADPVRGDAFEQWLKAQRDAHGWQGSNDRRLYDALDIVLDRYRLHADTGTPLGEQPAPDEAMNRVVAYVLAERTDLHCLRCAPARPGDIWTPVTAEDLEDGGICTACGADVLAPQPRE